MIYYIIICIKVPTFQTIYINISDNWYAINIDIDNYCNISSVE